VKEKGYRVNHILQNFRYATHATFLGTKSFMRKMLVRQKSFNKLFII